MKNKALKGVRKNELWTSVKEIKKRKKVARNGWNGKGMYIQLHKGTDFEHAIIEPFLVIKNVKIHSILGCRVSAIYWQKIGK